MGAPTRGNGAGAAAASSSARAGRRSPLPALLPLLLILLLASATPTLGSSKNNQLLFANGTAITLERRRAPERKPARRGGGGEDRSSNTASEAAALAQACCVPLNSGGGAQALSAVDPGFSLHSDPSCSPGSRLCALPATTARAVWVCGCGSSGDDEGGRCFGGRAAAAASGSALGDPQKDSGAKGGGQVQGGSEAFLRGEGAVVAVRVAVASPPSSGGGSKGGGGKGSSSSAASSSRCPVRGLQFEYTGGATLTIGAGFDGALEVKELALLPGEALVAVSGRVASAGGATSSSSSSRRGGSSGGRTSSERSSPSSSSNTQCLAYVSLSTSRGRELSAGRKKSGSSSSSSSSSSRGESGLAVARAPGGGSSNNNNQQRLVAAEALVRPDGSLGWLRPLWGHDGCPAAVPSAAAAPKPNAAKPAAKPANAPKTAADAAAEAKNKPSAPNSQAPKPNAAPVAPIQQQTPQQPAQQPQPQAPRPPSNPYPLCGPPSDPVCDRSTTPPRCFCMTDPPDNFLGQTCPEDGSCLGGCCATTGQCPRVMGREAPKGYSGGPVQFFLARGCADWGLQPSAERTVAEGKARNTSEAASIVLPACGKGVPMTEGEGGAGGAVQRPECGALYDCVPPRGRPCAPGLPGALCMGYTRCKEGEDGKCVGMSNEAACVYRPDGTRQFDVCGCRPIYPPPTAAAASERRRRRKLVF